MMHEYLVRDYLHTVHPESRLKGERSVWSLNKTLGVKEKCYFHSKGERQSECVMSRSKKKHFL